MAKVVVEGEGASPRTATAPGSTKCLMCPMTFPRPLQAVLHMKAVHLHRQPYLCMLCGERFDHADKLGVHDAEEHDAAPNSVECLVCPETFPTVPESVQHMRTVHLHRQPYLCLVCGERFGSYLDFGVHVEGHAEKDVAEGHVVVGHFVEEDLVEEHVAVDNIVERNARGEETDEPA